MTAGRELRPWSFGLFWILANIVGWALFSALGLAAGWLIWELYEQGGNPRLLRNEAMREFLTIIILGCCWGAALGWLQQVVLKRRFRLEAGRWVWATLFGVVLYALFEGLVSYLLIAIPSSRSSYNLLHALVSVVPPLALGLAQWYVLRRSLGRAGWWVFAVVLGLWLPGILLSAFASGPITSLSIFISPALAGVTYGAATLVVLAVLPRQRADAELAG